MTVDVTESYTLPLTAEIPSILCRSQFNPKCSPILFKSFGWLWLVSNIWLLGNISLSLLCMLLYLHFPTYVYMLLLLPNISSIYILHVYQHTQAHTKKEIEYRNIVRVLESTCYQSNSTSVLPIPKLKTTLTSILTELIVWPSSVMLNKFIFHFLLSHLITLCQI